MKTSAAGMHALPPETQLHVLYRQLLYPGVQLHVCLFVLPDGESLHALCTYLDIERRYTGAPFFLPEMSTWTKLGAALVRIGNREIDPGSQA
jgi:hypothetical protein